MLQKGGNAVDAAIATAAALNVVEPLMSGIGGEGFLMIYWKSDDRLSVVNATGAAPAAATRERFLPQGIPMKGILSALVPGLVDGWLTAHEKYGYLSLADVFAAGMDLATNGFPTSHVLAKAIAADPLICEFPTSKKVFSPTGGRCAPANSFIRETSAELFRPSSMAARTLSIAARSPVT